MRLGDVQEGKGGAPLIGGDAPGVAGVEMATVLWPEAPDQIDCRGTAVGLLEWRDTNVNEVGVGEGLVKEKKKARRQQFQVFVANVCLNVRLGGSPCSQGKECDDG